MQGSRSVTSAGWLGNGTRTGGGGKGKKGMGQGTDKGNWRYQESTRDSKHRQLLEMWKPGHYTRDCISIVIVGEGETGEDDWTWNAQH